MKIPPILQFVRSIQWKIALWSGLCLSILAAVIIAYAAISLGRTAIHAAQQEAIAISEDNAVRINEEIEVAWNTARTLEQILSTVKDPDAPLRLTRDQVNQILQQVLIENPDLVGVYTLWEPDGFDGNDTRYANAEGHDETGRFIPYWSRDRQGNTMLNPRTAHDDEGEARRVYECPKQTRLECILNPYSYPVQGEPTLISSLVVPIIVGGQFYGVVGVDIRMDYFQRLADSVNIYDQSGWLAVIANDGTVAAITDRPGLVGQYATVIHEDFDTDDELGYVRRGERVVEFDQDNDLEVFIPIHFWRTWSPWSVSITVPREKIATEARTLMWQMIGMGTALTLAALVFLGMIARQIALPIRAMTETARTVSEGKLDVDVVVQSNDETRVLAQTFNQMIAGLRRMVENDRKANEELVRQNEEQKRLLDLVATLETPVIPLVEGVLLAPIVGTLDRRRTQALTERLLREVYARHASQVILDITGVVAIDTQVAMGLLQTAQSVRLLGCSLTMTGISANVAATITQLGIDLSAITTAHSLQEVLLRISADRLMEHQRQV
ncbi:MAG: HAMP domain-containing protein [Chloroflexaceae bacterium]|nr:HAMP domain-containing protein [Chloroflexaceae bacterium]